MSLIQAIEKAKTKDELEALGVEQLGVDVDKRKTKEVLRAELLALAEDANGPTEAASPEASDDTAATDPEPKSAPAEVSAYKGRLMRHKVTGVVFPYTAAMAKNKNLEEV